MLCKVYHNQFLNPGFLYMNYTKPEKNVLLHKLLLILRAFLLVAENILNHFSTLHELSDNWLAFSRAATGFWVAVVRKIILLR